MCRLTCYHGLFYVYFIYIIKCYIILKAVYTPLSSSAVTFRHLKSMKSSIFE